MPLSTVPPAPAAPHPAGAEQIRTLLRAASTARRRYPGPVGELLHRELMAWHSFGSRFGQDGLILRLVDELGAEPLVPGVPAAAERLAS